MFLSKLALCQNRLHIRYKCMGKMTSGDIECFALLYWGSPFWSFTLLVPRPFPFHAPFAHSFPLRSISRDGLDHASYAILFLAAFHSAGLLSPDSTSLYTAPLLLCSISVHVPSYTTFRLSTVLIHIFHQPPFNSLYIQTFSTQPRDYLETPNLSL